MSMRWLAALLLAGSAPDDVEIRGMRHPALSPDGLRLAFSWRGDLWVCPAEGGAAERVTDDPADEGKACWSPDGRRLAYASDANGTLDLFVVELETRAVRRLTHHTSDDDAPAWSPDGAWIAFQSNRDSNLDLALNDGVWDVWKMPAEGGTATRVTRFRGENPAWSPDGAWIAYDRYSSGYGDGEHNLFLIDAEGRGPPAEIASGGEDSRRPVFRGKAVYFAHEAHGLHASAFRNVWRTSRDGGPLHQVTGHAGDHVTWPTVAGERLVYEFDFDLYAIDLRQTRPAPRKLAIRAAPPPELPPSREVLASGLRSPAWSPSGRRIAFAAGGRIWTSSADGGEARLLGGGGGEDRDPSWTADESAVVFVSAPPGLPGHLWRAPSDGGAAAPLTREEAAYRTPRVSPDGREILVVAGAELRSIDVRNGTSRSPAGRGFSPCWSADGRSIFFLREEEKGTAILRVPRDGGFEILVRGPNGRRDGLQASPDGKRLAWEQLGPGAQRTLRVGAIEAADDAALVARGVGRPSWSPDSSMLAAELPGRSGSGVLVLDAGGAGRLPLRIRAEREVPRSEEAGALFGQVWAAYFGSYYDPFFHGVDMMALRRKYLPFAEACRTRAELYDLINDMLRELRSSHIHLKPPAVKTAAPTGALGADLERGPDGVFVLRRIEPGGPADRAGLREGEALRLRPGEDLDRLLAGEATLRVGDRDVTLRGISRTALRELKYANQVEARKRRVRELSGGRLAYFHIRMMAASEVARLKEAMEKEFPDAEGLVFDERDGVGGFAHRPVCALLDSTAPERLNRHPACAMRNRDGTIVKDVYRDAKPPARSWNRPVIMIQNEISRSDKEILPYTFRHLGIGYLVGMPTAGGVIGGNEWTMRDGSRIVVSVQGWFTLDGRNMEGWGVPPDYRVPLTHEDLYAHRDPQLDKAVEVLLAQMDGRIAPPRKPEVENK